MNLKTFKVNPHASQALVAIAMMYNLVSSVLRMTFVEFEEQNQFLVFTLDSLCDVIYLLDFAVKFRTGHLDDGILVRDSSERESSELNKI